MSLQLSKAESLPSTETSICSPVGNWTTQNPKTIAYLKKLDATTQTLFSGIKSPSSSTTWQFRLDKSGTLIQSYFDKNASEYNQVLIDKKSVKYPALPAEYPEQVACFRKTFHPLTAEEQTANAAKSYGHLLDMMTPSAPASSSLDVGFVQLDSKGTLKFVIPPQFSAANPFRDGYAVVSKAGEKFLTHSPQFLIDTQGNKVSEEYDRIERFEYGYAPVIKDEKWGLINQSGKLVLPLIYDHILMYEADIAHLTVRRALEQPGQVGLINLKNGQIFVPPIYKFVSLSSERIAQVETLDDKTGYINFSGDIIFSLKKLESANYFSDGVAKIEDEKGVFFIDKTGAKILGPLSWPTVYSFHEGLAAVSNEASKCTKKESARETISCQTGKFGFIDKNGEVIIKPQFDAVESFSHGIASVALGKGKDRQWGLVDKTGKVLLEPQFFRIERNNVVFKNGLYVKDFSTVKVIKKIQNGKNIEFREGLIDTASGQILIEPKYLRLGNLQEGLIYALKGTYSKEGDLLMSKTGYLDCQGKTVIPFQFWGGGDFENGKAKVTYLLPQTVDPKNETWIDKTGKLFILPTPNPQLESLKKLTPMRQSTFDKITSEHLLEKL